MKVIITIKTPPLNWSANKVRMEQRDILVMLRREGAGNCEWNEEWFEGEPPSKAEQERYLHVRCSACDVEYYLATMDACERCGRRDTMEKVEPKRVPMPEPEPSDSALPAEPVVVTDATEVPEILEVEDEGPVVIPPEVLGK